VLCRSRHPRQRVPIRVGSQRDREDHRAVVARRGGGGRHGLHVALPVREQHQDADGARSQVALQLGLGELDGFGDVRALRGASRVVERAEEPFRPIGQALQDERSAVERDQTRAVAGEVDVIDEDTHGRMGRLELPVFAHGRRAVEENENVRLGPHAFRAGRR
jgi:hypothetical protein